MTKNNKEAQLKNNIPEILKAKSWTPYRLWRELGGASSARTLAYKLSDPEESLEFKKWETMLRVAAALEVPLAALAGNGDASVEFSPQEFVLWNPIPALLVAKGWSRYQLAQALGGKIVGESPESADRALAYKLGNPKESLAAKRFGTLWRVAELLGVGIDTLASVEVK
jgi:hypothetical protein